MPPISDEDQIRTLVNDWAKAVREQDIERVLARHADDVVMFDAALPLQAHGMDEYRTSWQLFFAGNPGGAGAFEVTDLRISASERVAYCHAILKILDSEARLTMGLRKGDGEWLIAHEHHSYPLQLDDA